MTRPALKNNGFTLIELLIVVVILSTLAAIVVPQFASSSDSAKEAAAKSSLSGIRSAMSLYNADHGNYPPQVPTTYCAAIPAGDKGTDDAGKLLDTMRYYSDSAGNVCNTNTAHPYGPYLRAREFPVNPLVNSNVVVISAASTLGLTTTATGGAWRYQPATGEVIIDDTTDNRHKY